MTTDMPTCQSVQSFLCLNQTLNCKKTGLCQTRFCSKRSCILLAKVRVIGELFEQFTHPYCRHPSSLKPKWLQFQSWKLSKQTFQTVPCRGTWWSMPPAVFDLSQPVSKGKQKIMSENSRVETPCMKFYEWKLMSGNTMHEILKALMQLHAWPWQSFMKTSCIMFGSCVQNIHSWKKLTSKPMCENNVSKIMSENAWPHKAQTICRGHGLRCKTIRETRRPKLQLKG